MLVFRSDLITGFKNKLFDCSNDINAVCDEYQGVSLDFLLYDNSRLS